MTTDEITVKIKKECSTCKHQGEWFYGHRYQHCTRAPRMQRNLDEEDFWELLPEVVKYIMSDVK